MVFILKQGLYFFTCNAYLESRTPVTIDVVFVCGLVLFKSPHTLQRYLTCAGGWYDGQCEAAVLNRVIRWRESTNYYNQVKQNKTELSVYLMW